jgi:hypothetical protein
MHSLDSVHGIETVLPRRFESELFAKIIEELHTGLFPNTHRAIALNIAVPAHRAQASARLPDLAPQKHQVDDFLNVRNCVFVLRQSHRPAADHAFRIDEDSRRIFQLTLGHPRLIEYVA